MCNSRPTLKMLDHYPGVNKDDPIRFYRLPIIGGLFRKRIEICLSQLPQGQRILEVGFGSGVTFLNLADNFHEIHGLDLTADVKEISGFFAQRQLKTNLVNGSVFELPYADNFFDSVLLISILEHIQPEEQAKAFLEINRVLRPGGSIVYGVPVERPLMVAMYKLLGFNIHDFHFSTEKDVLNAADKVFQRQALINLKFMGFTLYQVCHCKKTA